MRGTLVACAIAALAVAGCLGTEDVPAPATAQEDPVCPGPLCDPALPDGPAPDARAETVRVPFAFDGSTDTFVCQPRVEGTPRAVGCPRIERGSWEPPEVVVPRPLRVVANVTTTSETHLPQEYYLSLVVDMGDGWEWDPEREPETRGVPPLAVDWDVTAYPDGTKFWFWVEAYGGEGPVVYGEKQAYRVEGALLGHP